MSETPDAVAARALAAWWDAARAGRPVVGIVIDGRLVIGADDYARALARMDERQAVRAEYGRCELMWMDA